MIKDLQHIVTSYLDLNSYLVLSNWKPQKYNKVQQIKKHYESAIPNLTKFEIVKTGIMLKCDIVDLFNTVLQGCENLSVCSFKVNAIIEQWIHLMVNNLFLKCKNLNLGYDLSAIIFYNYSQINTVDVELTNKLYTMNHRISYPNNIMEYSRYEVIKNFVELKENFYKLNDTEFKEYSKTLIKFTGEITDEDKEQLHNFFIENDLTTLQQTQYENSKEYYTNNLFKFNIYNSSLIFISDNEKFNISSGFMQGLYYILETVSEFRKIYKQYYNILLFVDKDETISFG